MFSGSISDAVQAREAPVHRSLLQSQNTDGVRMSLWVNNISIHGSVLLSLLIQENTVSLTVRFIKWELSVRIQHSAGKQQAHSVKPLPKKGHSGSTEGTSVPEKTPVACRADPAAT